MIFVNGAQQRIFIRKYEECPGLYIALVKIEHYRQLEFVVFYCQMLGLMCYIVVCKFMRFLKLKLNT